MGRRCRILELGLKQWPETLHCVQGDSVGGCTVIVLAQVVLALATRAKISSPPSHPCPGEGAVAAGAGGAFGAGVGPAG